MVWVVAHRGASGDAPENTLCAFRIACEQGADAIELDVRLSRDKVPVVIHDETVDRTTDGNGKVAEKSLDQLKALTLMRGEAIPTLDEVLAWGGGKTKFVVELKTHGAEKMIVQALQKQGIARESVIVSSHDDAIREVKKLDPFIQTGLIVFEEGGGIDRAIACRANWLCIKATRVSLEFARHCRENGLRLSAGPVDSPEDAKALLKLPVAALITNHVPIIRPLLRKY